MPPKALELGLTGQTVARNIARIRAERGLSLRELADRMPEGRKLNHAQLSAAERGVRQVTVDDLTAISVALSVSPVALLMPESNDDQAGAAALTGTGEHSATQLLDWLIGECDLVSDPDDGYAQETHRRLSLPRWRWTKK
ncbi:Helix-turn-helix [Mycobacterium basiliense]|uniref:Helix-turn-helix n=1 Tax=Mycobacterium basiliense TaxID=2094119 RepID=A0A447GJH5_9MYCO|nr:Helix-turn-helix [Mycobacterium basiliense]